MKNANELEKRLKSYESYIIQRSEDREVIEEWDRALKTEIEEKMARLEKK